jgi:hypothetical protein
MNECYHLGFDKGANLSLNVEFWTLDTLGVTRIYFVVCEHSTIELVRRGNTHMLKTSWTLSLSLFV